MTDSVPILAAGAILLTVPGAAGLAGAYVLMAVVKTAVQGPGAVPALSYAEAGSSLVRPAKSRQSRCKFAERLTDAAGCRRRARGFTIR